jgi:hypothetical protein
MPSVASRKHLGFKAERVLGDNVKDVDAFNDLVTVVRGKRALALVGAGMSARVGYPSWASLMSTLADRAVREARKRRNSPEQAPRGTNEHRLPNEFRDDFTWQGEVLRTRIESITNNNDAYLAFLKETFALNERKPDRCSRLVAGLPFRHFLTTNYEQVLALAMKAERRVSPKTIDWTVEQDALRMMHTLLDEHEEPHLVYLHGRIENPEGIVLTDRDYARHYLRSDSTMRKLFALFALNRFVFFGFSLTDPDLMALMRQVAGGLAYERRPRHFVILSAGPGYPRDDMRERLINKFGVRPIFYENSDGKHTQFASLLCELDRRCRLRTYSPPKARDTAGLTLPLKAGAAGRTERKGRSLTPEARMSRTNALHPDDPRKGMFGGRHHVAGLRLWATVKRSPESSNWFDVTITVEAAEGSGVSLKGTVTFYLHDTFLTPIRKIRVRAGRARLEMSSYGAFTVGAITNAPEAELELDLAALPDIPKQFRES